MPVDAPVDPADAVRRARTVADEVLFPAAQTTDQGSSIPRANLEALRTAGLNGLQGPPDVPGGMGADHLRARPVFEAITGGCGATAFVWAQHHGAVRRLVGGDGPASATWLPAACDGSALAGIGFAYLRRPGPPAVRATQERGGWVIDGHAPWITGWGLIDVLVLMSRAEDGRVVTVAIDRPAERAELTPGQPQRLAAMGATGTVSLSIDRLRVVEAGVVGVQTDEAWRLRDRTGSALPPAAPLGIADRAIRLLAERGASNPAAQDAADRLGRELADRRKVADDVTLEVLGAVAAGDPIAIERAVGVGARERDRGLGLARRSTDALIAASGGRAMDLSDPAQRLSREATFYLIQAQTRALRTATLARSTGPSDRDPGL